MRRRTGVNHPSGVQQVVFNLSAADASTALLSYFLFMPGSRLLVRQKEAVVAPQLVLAYTQRVGHPVDVVEPGSDQSDLQNAAVIKTRRAQRFVIVWSGPGRIARDLFNIGQHSTLLIRDRRRPVIRLESANQFLIQSYSTQKLCVRLDSIVAPV